MLTTTFTYLQFNKILPQIGMHFFLSTVIKMKLVSEQRFCHVIIHYSQQKSLLTQADLCRQNHYRKGVTEVSFSKVEQILTEIRM